MEEKLFTATAVVLPRPRKYIVQFYFRHCGTTAALPADDLAEIAHTGPEAGRNSITYIIIFIYFLNWIF